MVPDSEFTCSDSSAARAMARCGVNPAAEPDEDVDPEWEEEEEDDDESAGVLLEQAVVNAHVAAPMTTAAACQEPARRGSDKWIKVRVMGHRLAGGFQALCRKHGGRPIA